MFKPTLALATCALLIFAVSTFADSTGAASGKASDYHFQASLSDGSASLRSVKLTWPVISNLLQADLQDLQVYNADQQPVPFTIRSLAASEKTQQQTRALNFFPMGDIEKLGTILKKEADEQRYKAIKLIQTGQRYLIIDNPKLDDGTQPLPLQTLTLNWQGLEHWLPKSLRIDVSDDLTQWRSVAIEKLPYRMAKNAVVLENNELRFSRAIQKRFIRLSGNEDFEPILKALKSVSGDFQKTSISRPMNWDNVDLQPTDDVRQFRYDLPPSLSVKRWRLEGLASDSLYKGQLYTRSAQRIGKKPADWRLSQNFLQYSITMGDGLVTSNANQAVNRGWSGEWRIDLEQTITAVSLPKLALAWEPLELVFVAQGKGPFEVRYGSRSAQASARMNLSELLQNATPQAVEMGAIKQLSKVVEKKEGSNYKYLLWGLLAAAVLMLLYMAKRLLREMGS